MGNSSSNANTVQYYVKQHSILHWSIALTTAYNLHPDECCHCTCFITAESNKHQAVHFTYFQPIHSKRKHVSCLRLKLLSNDCYRYIV